MDISNITTYQSGVAQSSAYRNLHKLFSKFLKDYDLTCMQWFVLGTIYDSGPGGIQLSKLATKLQTGLPFITNIINLLESKSMVVRRESETDSRAKFVSIAPDYRKECQQIEIDLRTKLRSSIYADITPDDLIIYIKVLYQLSAIQK
ncbi:MAG TPA: MarR family transcriptional regulator [Candidatus Saccharimonadales bacterium]|jgi:DNA-binding MarR family transcriptional regulator